MGTEGIVGVGYGKAGTAGMPGGKAGSVGFGKDGMSARSLAAWHVLPPPPPRSTATAMTSATALKLGAEAIVYMRAC